MRFCGTQAFLLSARCAVDGVEEERPTRVRCSAQAVANAREKGGLSILTIRGFEMT